MNSEATLTKPLFIAGDARAGEGLMSMMVRAAEANVMGRLHRLALFAGVTGARVDSIPFTRSQDAQKIAQLLSVDAAEVQGRMHPAAPHSSADEYVDWYGTPLHRRYLETRRRRVAPASLAAFGHDLAIWSVKPLTFCPDSLEHLVDQCPACGRTLTWAKSSSLSQCGSCGRFLVAGQGRRIEGELVDDARRVAALISPCDHERQSALSVLPAPFHEWEAGDVFQAVVELGLVSRSPVASPKCTRWATMSRGGFEDYSVDDLVAGYRFVRDWPHSLRSHLAGLTKSRTGTARNLMGRMGKYFDSQAPRTPVRKLVRQCVPELIHDLDVPLRVNQFRVDGVARRDDLVSATDAAVAAQTDKKMIARLASSPTCCIAKSPGTSLYSRAAVVNAFEAWRASSSIWDVAKAIGLPTYCVKALATARMIRDTDNSDAFLLSKDGGLIERVSVGEFCQVIQAVPIQEAGSRVVPLSEAMTGVLHPETWVRAFEGLLGGQLRKAGLAEGGGRLSDRILVYDQDFEHLRFNDERREPPESAVSALEAATILGVSNTLVSGAVQIGMIVGRQTSVCIEVPVSAVRRYRRDYIGAQEVSRKTGVGSQRFSAMMRARGCEPIGKVHSTTLWRRDDAVRIFPSQLQ